jgi:hypothetical protein
LFDQLDQQQQKMAAGWPWFGWGWRWKKLEELKKFNHGWLWLGRKKDIIDPLDELITKGSRSLARKSGRNKK